MTEAGTQQLGKHHVVPEVEQVEQQAQEDDDAQHEHVLRCPFHFAGIDHCGDIVAIVTAGSTVLCRQDEGIDNVNHSEGCQTDGSHKPSNSQIML